MKIFRNILAAGIMVLSLGCQQIEKVSVSAPEDVVPPVLKSMTEESIVVTSDNLLDKFEFAWDKADFGVLTQVDYLIKASVGESDPVTVFSGITSETFATDVQTLNTIFRRKAAKGGLGLPDDVEATLNIYVVATIGSDFPEFKSEPKTLKFTPADVVVQYPEIYAVGNFTGWGWNDPASRLFDFYGAKTYSGLIDIRWQAGFKFTGEKGWGNGNWGLKGDDKPADEAASLTLYDDGGSANVSVYSEHRLYLFSLNTETLKLTKHLSFDCIGAIGSFNGWSGDALMHYDPATQKLFTDIEITEDVGDVKFRLNGAWDTSYGVGDADKDTPMTEGVLDGGNNIKVPKGNYRVYVDMNNPEEMTFFFSEDDYKATTPGEHPVKPVEIWGICGSLTSWGDSPDIALEEKGDFWVAEGVEIPAAAEFQIRLNQGWTAQYGASENDPAANVNQVISVEGNQNIKFAGETGTYDVYFDKKNKKLYILTQGNTPDTI